MTTTRRAVLVLLAGLAVACDYRIDNTTPTGVTPIVPPTSTVQDTVEFRVQGDLPLVIVKVSNSLDGLQQSSSVLPYSSTLNIAGRDSVFLSLDARAPLLGAFGFLQVQIFVNGLVFREASSANLNPVAAVSGTWRRGR